MKTLGIILGIIIVVGGAVYFMQRPANTTNNGADINYNNTDNTNDTGKADGRVVFSVTDAAADMGAVSEINMKVSSVDVHSAANGWANVSTTPRVYNLLDLNDRNESELLADTNIEAGSYDQVRMTVDSVAVKTKAGATKTAKLPSNTMTINANLVVNENATSSANFDFLADKSLYTATNGDYIFAPVVKTETRSNTTATVDSASVVSINGGNVDDTNTIGMDIDGSVKANFQLKSTDKLNIGTDNKINVSL
jgi:hypothetical protein